MQHTGAGTQEYSERRGQVPSPQNSNYSPFKHLLTALFILMAIILAMLYTLSKGVKYIIALKFKSSLLHAVLTKPMILISPIDGKECPMLVPGVMEPFLIVMHPTYSSLKLRAARD
jgi:hypothetical protein